MSHAVGYSLPLSAREDLPRALDEAAAHRADSVELPAFGWDLVVGGRLLEARVEALAEDLVDRPFGYSVHGVLGVNFMDAADRLHLHDRVARANIEIAARLGARCSGWRARRARLCGDSTSTTCRQAGTG